MTDNLIPSSENISNEQPITGERYIDESGNVYEVVEVADNGNPLVLGGWWQDNPKELSLSDFMPDKSFKRKYIRLPEGTLDKSLEDALREPIVDPLRQGEEGESQSKALAPSLNQAQIRQYTSRFQAIADRSELVTRLMKRKMSEFNEVATVMRARLGYLEDVIGLFEQFLGVYQEALLLRDGQAAAHDCPIHFVQGVRWMDEEVGDVEMRRDNQRGIDFRSVEVFDQWVLEDDHLDLIFPYQKGVIAFQPSRQIRKYSDINFWYDLECKRENKVIYLLIRNGEKVFRIYTGVAFNDVMFPSVEKMRDIQQEMDEAEDKDEMDQLKAKKKELNVRKRVALLQGLIERTEMFDPRPANISLFREEDYESGRIVLVRDLENNGLPDGRMSYDAWKKTINDKIGRGSRVVICDLPYWVSNYRLKQPYRSHSKEHAAYRPKAGIYEVECQHVKDRGRFEIMFMPSKEVWNPSDGYKARERRISFDIYPSDNFVLNYDELSLEDVEFYIGRRFERRGYLDMLPVLYEFYRLRKAELRQEAEFVKYFAGIEGVEEGYVWEAVNWWKLKNILKRPLTKDEDKAWRMIRRRLKDRNGPCGM